MQLFSNESLQQNLLFHLLTSLVTVSLFPRLPLLTLLLYHNLTILSSTFSKIIKKFFIGLCEIFNNLRPGRFSPPGPARAPSKSGRKKRDILYPSTLASSQAIVFELVARNLIFFSCLPLSTPSRPNILTKASNSFLFI